MNTKKSIKKIIIGICLLTIVGCSSTSEKEYYENLQSSHKTNLKGDRVELYSGYKKDNFPVAKPISYLKYVNDTIVPKTPFKSYTESEFLSFYKNIKAKGHGDNSSYWRWHFTLTKKELNNILNKSLPALSSRRSREVLTYSNGEWIAKPLPLNPVGELQELKVVQRGKSGLIIKLLVKGTRGKYLVVKEGNIRNVLGLSKSATGTEVKVYGAKGGSEKYLDRPISRNPSLLPSGFFSFEKTSDGEYKFYGGGYGHGSGIPQWAAMDLTKNKGYSYQKVLQRYYANTKLKDINSIDGIGKNIRVGIMTSGFSSIDHSKIGIYSYGTIKLKSKGGDLKINPRTYVEFINQNGFTSVLIGGKVKLKTKHYISLSSNRMISVTNIKRNVKNYKYPSYRGNFEIRQSKNSGKLNLINEVSIEDYLLQVVPSEMPKSFGLEALKVQAIAARTYAAKDILKKRYQSLGFHILDSTQSQVYNNLDENEVAVQAVKSTKNLILVHEDKPIDAKYYSTSSGFNSNAHNVW